MPSRPCLCEGAVNSCYAAALVQAQLPILQLAQCPFHSSVDVTNGGYRLTFREAALMYAVTIGELCKVLSVRAISGIPWWGPLEKSALGAMRQGVTKSVPCPTLVLQGELAAPSSHLTHCPTRSVGEQCGVGHGGPV